MLRLIAPLAIVFNLVAATAHRTPGAIEVSPRNLGRLTYSSNTFGYDEGGAMGCLTTTEDGRGNINVQNDCGFWVHYYWTAYSKPEVTYNGVIQTGGSDSFAPGGEYRMYACNNAYFTVGPDGRIVHGIISSYSCVKK